MIKWLKGFLGTKQGAPATGRQAKVPIRGRYDNAQTTDENYRAWELTDFLSAKAANSYQVRRILKIRSRYECANNSYMRGMVLTLANDVIGQGPRLQVRTENKEANRAIEASFAAWSRAIGFAEKLRTMKVAKTQDGEAFGVFVTNKRVNHPVKLDLNVIESDQVMTPDPKFVADYFVDGVILDKLGNPVSWHILRQHPGDVYMLQLNPMKFDTVPAHRVVQWFRKDRPGQVRGVPEFLPSLDLFSKMRRYTVAVLMAAETAADYSAVLKSTGPADDTTDDPTPFESLEIERGMMVTMPNGWDMNQFDPKQPIQTYEMFQRCCLREIARCVNMPYNVAAGDSSGYNYASGRLDWQNFHSNTKVERSQCESVVLDPTFATWLQEAALADPTFPAELAMLDEVPHRWFWPAAEHVDPEKEARGDSERLASNTATLAEIYAEDGQDWEEAIRQRGAEVALLKEMGLPTAPDQPTPPDETDEIDDDIRDVAEEEDEDEVQGKHRRPLIQAAAEPANFRFTGESDFKLECEVDATDPDKPTKFSMTAYTGGPMKLAGFYSPVIIDLASATAPRQSVPVPRQHDPNRLVGHTTSIDISPKRIKATGIISHDNPHSAEIKASAKKGFPWQASVGGDADSYDHVPEGEIAKVNGGSYPGPLTIARGAKILEISVVPIGADGNTCTTMAAANSREKVRTMTFDQYLTAKAVNNATLTEQERATWQVAYKAEQQERATWQVAYKAEHPTPAPVVTTPPPIQAGATIEPLDVNKLVADMQAKLQANAANEIARQNAIHAICDVEPGLVAEVTVDGKKQTVNILEYSIRAGLSAERVQPMFELAQIRAARDNGAVNPVNFYSPQKAQITEAVLEAAVMEAGRCPLLDDGFYAEYGVPHLLAAKSRREMKVRYTDEVQQSAHDLFHGRIGLQQLFHAGAMMNGKRISEVIRSDSDIEAAFRANNWQRSEGTQFRAAGDSTMSIANTLANVLNKYLLAGYMFVEMTWREICSVLPVKDFKPTKSVSIFGDVIFKGIGQNGELEHGTVQDQAFANQAATVGRILELDRKSIINDDLSALTTLPMHLGRGAGLAANDTFWKLWLTPGDDDGGSTAFWAATHTITGQKGNSNFISGGTSAISSAALQTAQQTYDKQVDPKGYPLGVEAKKLLYPPELEAAVWQLLNSELIVSGATTTNMPNANRWKGRFTPHKSRYLSNSLYTNSSTTAWWLLADPEVISVIQAVFLNGQESPTVQSAIADFTRLGIQIRGFWDLGFAMQNFRGGIMSAGA